mgnify:CR=1 FL=1
MDNQNEYQFHIIYADQRSRWILISDKDGICGYESEPFVYLLKRLMDIYDDIPVDLGKCRYSFKKDPNNFVYQWDDLFGIVFEYRSNYEKALNMTTQLLKTVNT